MSDENNSITKPSNKSLVFSHVQVDIHGTVYTYFMTNDIKLINAKLAELGCRSIVPSDFRWNPKLAQSVRSKMKELQVTFSLLINDTLKLINYYAGKGDPFIIFVNELISLNNVTHKNISIQQISADGKRTWKEFSTLDPLSIAIIKKAKGTVKILLDAGLDVNAKRYEGITPLMLASVLGETEIVKMLIAYGADIHAKANNGMSALYYALSASHSDIVQVLTDAGAQFYFPIFTAKERMSFHDVLAFYISECTFHGLGKTSLIWKRTKVYGNTYALSRQTFSKVRRKNHHPEKKTIFLLAIGMELTLAQTENLLLSAGYTFDDTNAFEKIVKNFIKTRNFNMPKIEETLYAETGSSFCKY